MSENANQETQVSFQGFTQEEYSLLFHGLHALGTSEKTKGTLTDLKLKLKEKLGDDFKDPEQFDDSDAKQMHEKVLATRLQQTIKESKAGLKAGWPHDHLPDRSRIPPNWEIAETTADTAEYVVFEIPDETPKQQQERMRKQSKRRKPKLKIVKNSTGETQDVPEEEKKDEGPEPVPIMRITAGGSLEEDGKKWIHVAVSQVRGYPHWLLIKMVKAYILGPEAWAYLVLTPDSPQSSAGTVMHFFHCIDAEKPHGQVLPDFSKGLGII